MYTCIILCGGYGKRAKKINKFLPKALIEVKKKPFLYWILKNLEKKKIRNVILCVGYKGNLIHEYINKNKNKFKIKINLVFEKSNNLLGTGGAIKNALKIVKDEEFIVMYGDTFLFFNMKKLYKSYLDKKKPILMTIYKNKDGRYKNNINIVKKFIYNKFDNSNFYKYIDYGIMIMKKKIFKNQPKVFDLSKLLNFNSKLNNISYFKIKKKFLEIGDLEGYKKTSSNFKLIQNEIYN